MLHFNGLNRNTYRDLDNEIYKVHRIRGVHELPKRYNWLIFLVGEHDKEKG